MNREEWRGFFNWLDTASLEELRDRATKIAALLEELRDPDVRRDAQRMRRAIEEEILLRLARR